MTTVSTNSDPRPISPYLIGPYYRPQLTSMLSIASRLTGVFMTTVLAPVMALWLLALALGPDSYAVMTGLLATWPGQVLVIASLFSLCYHLMNGIRHLIWDTGRMLEIRQIYTSGWIMVVLAFSLALWVWWSAGAGS